MIRRFIEACWSEMLAVRDIFNPDDEIRPEVERLIQSADDDLYNISMSIEKTESSVWVPSFRYPIITATHSKYPQISIRFVYTRIVGSRDAWELRIVGATGLLPLNKVEHKTLVDAFRHHLNPTIREFHLMEPRQLRTTDMDMCMAINIMLPLRSPIYPADQTRWDRFRAKVRNIFRKD
jgi:hypothetical protein